jgi:hypothetical protein
MYRCWPSHFYSKITERTQKKKATLHIRNASNLGTGQTKLLRTD